MNIDATELLKRQREHFEKPAEQPANRSVGNPLPTQQHPLQGVKQTYPLKGKL